MDRSFGMELAPRYRASVAESRYCNRVRVTHESIRYLTWSVLASENKGLMRWGAVE